MQPMIQTDALSFSYPVEEGQRRTTALDNVTLSIEKGSFVVVLGHNGSGKSTLAKHMNAVLLPSGGAVYVEGMDTKKEELLLEIRRRVDDALAAVGMTEFTRHAPHLLSGGQKQRVAIAGVIAMEPECIVLDEATAMLDPSGRREVLDTVHRLNRQRGITVVHITHHMSEAEDADRVIVMNDGVVAMDGAPREIFSRVEELQALGLAAPDTVELLRRLNRHGMNLPLTAITVDECARAIFQALHGAEGK